MTHKKPLPIIEVPITKFSSKGNGVGVYNHSSGSICTAEVPFSIPGDYVKAKVFKKRNKIHYGFLDEVITPSKDRHPSRCMHFGVCGGCRWQQISYEKQLIQKEESVRECFKELLNDTVDFRKIIPSTQEWEYRNKMEFTFSENIQGDRYLGLIMDSSQGKVLNITECHLVRKWYMLALEATRQWWEKCDLKAYKPHKNTGSLRVLTLREGMRTGDKLIMLTVSGNPDYALKKEQLNTYVNILRETLEKEYPNDKLSIFLRIQQTAKGMATHFYEMHLYGPDHIREILNVEIDNTLSPLPLTFHISPSAFFQPNTFQAEKFYSLALQLAETDKNSIVYDLYCGTGTIGISIAKHVKAVVGVEISPEAALDAKTNAALNNISNYTIFCGAVRNLLNTIIEEKNIPPPDVILLDPPRSGLTPSEIESVLAFNVPKIVYISCNPKTQASNIAHLIQAGYRIILIQPVDQFPHTVHIENIVILEKMDLKETYG